MRKILKPFLLWLLLIAVPFQGYAAATMMCCGSAHSKGAEHESQEPMGNVHSHLSGTDHDHDEDAVAASNTTESDSGSHHHDGDTKRIAFKCSACASCCVGAAIVQTSVNSLSVAPLNSTRIAFFTRYFYRFVPDTLERPPYRLVA